MATPGEPRVGVNPVSALTPGILRRIFEPVQPREAERRARETGGTHMLRSSGLDADGADASCASRADAARLRRRTRRLKPTRSSACFFLPSESLIAPSTRSAAVIVAVSSVTACRSRAARRRDVALGFAVGGDEFGAYEGGGDAEALREFFLRDGERRQVVAARALFERGAGGFFGLVALRRGRAAARSLRWRAFSSRR